MPPSMPMGRPSPMVLPPPPPPPPPPFLPPFKLMRSKARLHCSTAYQSKPRRGIRVCRGQQGWGWGGAGQCWLQTCCRRPPARPPTHPPAGPALLPTDARPPAHPPTLSTISLHAAAPFVTVASRTASRVSLCSCRQRVGVGGGGAGSWGQGGGGDQGGQGRAEPGREGHSRCALQMQGQGQVQVNVGTGAAAQTTHPATQVAHPHQPAQPTHRSIVLAKLRGVHGGQALDEAGSLAHQVVIKGQLTCSRTGGSEGRQRRGCKGGRCALLRDGISQRQPSLLARQALLPHPHPLPPATAPSHPACPPSPGPPDCILSSSWCSRVRRVTSILIALCMLLMWAVTARSRALSACAAAAVDR